jgi:single-strand DNA-binding protein
MSFHEVTIVGNLGRDPDLHYTPGGQAVANFPLAANRRFRNPQGEAVKETVWFQVTAWERQAENAVQYLKKGSQVMVKGRLTPDPETGAPRLWERRDGNPAASYEVTAREIVYLNGRDAGSNGETPAPVAGVIDEDIPF